jgi:hypothetical protein
MMSRLFHTLRTPGAIVTVAIALVLLGAERRALGGQIEADDFGDLAVLEDFEGLGLQQFPPTPLVIGTDSYTTDGVAIRYHDFDPPAVPMPIPGQDGFRLANFTDTGFIDIVFGTALKRAGAFIGQGNTWTATAEFFDEADELLGTVAGSGPDFSSAFAGWEADVGLIKRVRFTDTASNSSILLLDNLKTEIPVPEPSRDGLRVCALAVLAALAVRKRRPRWGREPALARRSAGMRGYGWPRLWLGIALVAATGAAPR